MKQKMVINGKPGQHLNHRELHLIHDLKVDGLLWLNAESAKNSITLRYDTDGLISVSDHLRRYEMSKRMFVILMRSIVIALKSVEKNKFSKDLIEWNIHASYIEPSTLRVYLMYVPLQPYETSGNLKSYLQDIVSVCRFLPGEKVSYVQELVRELNAGVSYTVHMLEAYCDRISESLFFGQAPRSETVLCRACKAKLASGETVCPYCGEKMGNIVSDSGVEISYQNDVPSLDSKSDNTTKTRAEKSLNDHRGSVSVHEDKNGIVTVFRGARTIRQTIWLESREYVGKIVVTKFPFRIGKMEGITDYRICRNTVSRKHADILKEQGNCFVVDLGSTNGTYLNGKRLQPGVKEMLNDGDMILFADAEFKFHID